MRYLLGVDFGGSSSKATLLGEDGRVAATATCEYPTYYPQSGWAEQNPEDSWNAFVSNVRELLEKSGVAPEDIAAVALDAATHTAVLLDAQDRPVRNAIYWTDTRASAEADELRARCGEEITRLSFNSVSSLWTLPQLLWLSRHEPETLARTAKIMAVKDYIRYRLTGDFVTDDIEAMGFMLLDANRNVWSGELCALAGVAADRLPPLVRPTQRLSALREEAARETGLRRDTLVIAGTTDTVMEVYAAGAIAPGQATVKLATAGRICAVTERAVVDPCLVTYRHVIDGLWYPGTATKACASSYRWYRDTFGGSYKELDAGASEVPVGSDGLIYHPYINGELTPYADPLLCGSFTGIRTNHTKGHFSRAVMEGVAMSLVDSIGVIHRLGIEHDDTAAIIGGGAYSPLWRQIVSDALGMEFHLKESSDSSFGTAMLAGVAVGAFDSFEGVIQKCSKTIAVTTPNPANKEKYTELFETYKAIHDALAPIYHNR